uniref:Uncharacterized protein n=1 Tax=Panagrolaimus sp. PS1159 TaxID=55785 RepID=A0AC35FIT7_9BILA
MGSVTADDITMNDPLITAPVFTQNCAKRHRLPSNSTKENAILHEHIADLRKALDEAYKNVEVYRNQFLKAQQEKEREKEEKEFLLKQLRRVQQQNAAKTDKTGELETASN